MVASDTIPSPRHSPPARALAAVVLGNVALAFGPWLVRLADVGPVAAAFWRMALAAPVLVVAALALGGVPRVTRGLAWVLVAAGVCFAADLASWHLGITMTKLANATLFGNVTSLLFPIYGFLVARAWPNRAQVAALSLAAIGATLMLGRSYELSPDHLAGDLLSVLAGVFYTVYFVLMTRARDTMAPMPALALSTLASIAPLALLVVWSGEAFLPGDWTAVILLAIVSQLLGQFLMIYALGHLEPIVIGVALLIQPIVAGTIGWLAYGETLGPVDLVGAAMVAAALVLVRRTPRTPVQLAPAVAPPRSDA